MMTGSEIRKKYLEFFKRKGHTIVESDLLVPKNDPTLLFTGAGMNQFKQQFMGKNVTYTRATSSQKCLRTGDLENVGRTPRHHTFFEMLGNFSFGDYFKKEAIAWGWEFMTKEMGIPEDRLWVSVYYKDDEAYDIWLKEVKVPASRIVKLGEHDNFWPADAPAKGPNGPCGPCSEIFYDFGKDLGCGKADCNPACDCGRFVEVWNLVFTQYDRQPDGSLKPLPKKNIDTGMGLERIAAVMQGVRTNFDTDLFKTIHAALRREVGDNVPNANLIADHIRAAVFCVSDGVSPSNEKQGYVVRKLIRRAYLKSGKKEPFLYNVVPAVTAMFKDIYPEIEEKREHIAAIVCEEEKRFNETLNSAIPVLEGMLENTPGALSGEQIFKLVDTYGLPVDIINDEAETRKLKLDMAGFEKFMEERKEQSRKGSDITSDFIFQPDKFKDAPNPVFSEALPLETKIQFILKAKDPADTLVEGDRAEVITSPQSARFYAESGGQVGDTGSIEKPGAKIDILNTYDAGGRKVLEVIVRKGSFKKGDSVTLALDGARNLETAKNHTATHLLQAALRSVLGEQVKQSGSMVNDERLRFDFTHMKKLSDRELARIEEIVNTWVTEKIPVCKAVKGIKEAREEGALSFFGEKYGEMVRVVSVGDKSKEFCGGSHVDNTNEIEIVKVTSESSVASGIRRIEAVTGAKAREWVKKSVKMLIDECQEAAKRAQTDVKATLPVLAKDIVDGKVAIDHKVAAEYEENIKPALLTMKDELEKAAKKLAKDKEADAFSDISKKLDEIASGSIVLSGANFVSAVIDGVDMQILIKAANYVEKKVKNVIVLLGGVKEDKVFLICAVSPELVKSGVDARKVINAAAPEIGGGGGGRAEFAQAGGKNASGLAKALELGRTFVEKRGS